MLVETRLATTAARSDIPLVTASPTRAAVVVATRLATTAARSDILLATASPTRVPVVVATRLATTAARSDILLVIASPNNHASILPKSLMLALSNDINSMNVQFIIDMGAPINTKN